MSIVTYQFFPYPKISSNAYYLDSTHNSDFEKLYARIKWIIGVRTYSTDDIRGAEAFQTGKTSV